MDKHVLRSEWLKFFSYPWCVAGFIGAVFLPALGLLLNKEVLADRLFEIGSISELCLPHLFIGQVGIIIAMAGLAGQEYFPSMLRTTLLATPARIGIFLMKRTVLLISTVAAGITASSICLLMAITVYHYEPTAASVLELGYLVALTSISWLVLGSISMDFAIITKSLVGPIAILLPLVLGLSQLLLVITSLAKYLPDIAGMNLFLYNSQKVFLEPVTGMLIQLIWAAVFISMSSYLFCRRDVR